MAERIEVQDERARKSPSRIKTLATLRQEHIFDDLQLDEKLGTRNFARVVEMLASLSALLVFITFHYRSCQLAKIFKYLGNLTFRGLILIALLFARAVGAFFSLLLLTFFDFPSWILSKISSTDSPSICEKWPQPDIRSPAQDVTADWVRVSLCNTDRISHLDLGEGHDCHAIDDAYERSRGQWEKRTMHRVTPEVIKHRVLPWLDQIAEDHSDDSAYQSDAEEMGEKAGGSGEEMSSTEECARDTQTSNLVRA